MEAAESVEKALCRFWATILEPPPRLNCREWSDAYRYLPRESSAQPGKYRSAIAPYQREPMESVGDTTVQTVCLMFASQTGKTEILNNIVGFFIACDPSPILVVQPTLELGESWSKERLVPTIRDTPVLTPLVRDSKSRDSGNTILHKTFPGGNIAIAGANSPSGLAGRPRRVVLLDEVDRFPASAGSEGDPCALAIRRTESFWNSVILLTSTPTLKGASRIESEFLQTDQRRWFCACPKCGHADHLKWSQIKWPADTPQAAYYECPHCAYRWDDVDRLRAVKAGEWRPTAPFQGKRGYHLNGISSPFKAKKGYVSRLHQMVAQFLEAKHGGDETLKTWVNTFLAETWEVKAEQLEWSPLLQRAEDYEAPVPHDACLLTAAVDVQKDRIEIEVVAWGDEEESWGVEKHVIWGDFDLPDTQNHLDDFLNKRWTHATGVELSVTAVAIDSGHKTKSVYHFAKSRSSRRCYAVKGSATPNSPVVTPRYNKHYQVWLYSVGTDTAKESIFSRLKITEPGPRFMHFPKGQGYTESYFKQLCSEKIQTTMERGVVRRRWVKQADRNEALDLRVYNLAAYDILRPNMIRVRASVITENPTAVSKEYVLKPSIAVKPAAPPAHRPIPSRPRQGGGGFVNGWKR